MSMALKVPCLLRKYTTPKYTYDSHGQCTAHVPVARGYQYRWRTLTLLDKYQSSIWSCLGPSCTAFKRGHWNVSNNDSFLVTRNKPTWMEIYFTVNMFSFVYCYHIWYWKIGLCSCWSSVKWCSMGDVSSRVTDGLVWNSTCNMQVLVKYISERYHDISK